MENMKAHGKIKNVTGNVERKPSIKLKTAPPPVRQTLTSYKRMLKANPLLRYQEAGIDIDELFKSRGNNLKASTNSEIVDSKASSILEGKSSLREFTKPLLGRTQSLRLPKASGCDVVDKRISIISGNQPIANHNVKKPPINFSNTNKNTAKSLLKPKTDVISKYLGGNRVESKKPRVEVKAKVNSVPKNSISTIPKISIKPEAKSLPKKKVSTFRRSLSSGHLQSKKGKRFDPQQGYTKASQSRSEDNISVFASNAPLGFSPILEESNGSRNLIFKTPSASDGRSVCHFTPRSVRRGALFQASTPAPVEVQRLQETLNKWLKSRGKPLAFFHHLRCFGIDEAKKTPPPAQIDEENKENIELIQAHSLSYEDLKISVRSEENKEDLPVDLPINNDIPEEELGKVAKEAMVELLKLIEKDYPRAQCFGWLELIREKCKRAVDEPEYWECRAAIEQSIGNVGKAVEFYKTAIIQGAEVSAVDKSLDQLSKKFSLLNITPNKSEPNKLDGNKERIVREARTVFKSTIIQFAIQERKLKKKGNDEASVVPNAIELVATPVRRTTRMSRSGYISTPGVKLCSSLKEINLSSEEINFEKNKALC